MGVQARSHIEAMKLVLPIKKVLCWSRTPEKHQDLVDLAKSEFGLEVEATTIERVAQEADILVDATYSMQPLISDSLIRNGTLVIGLFHSGKSVQFEAATVNRGKAYLDFNQSKDCGTIVQAKTPEELEKMVELKDIIGHEEYRVTPETLVYFQSGGTSIEDLAAAISLAEAS
jgi:ornithine cyclodeaminase/alanine dehydrogenase-like protein (mu-crystallin family)